MIEELRVPTPRQYWVPTFFTLKRPSSGSNRKF